MNVQACGGGFGLFAVAILGALAVQFLVACGSDITPPTSAPIPISIPTASNLAGASQRLPTMQAFPVPSGSRPHDVAPAVDGGVWYAAQGSGELGWLDPDTGETMYACWVEY